MLGGDWRRQSSETLGAEVQRGARPTRHVAGQVEKKTHRETPRGSEKARAIFHESFFFLNFPLMLVNGLWKCSLARESDLRWSKMWALNIHPRPIGSGLFSLFSFGCFVSRWFWRFSSVLWLISDLELPLILRTANTEDLFCTGHAKLLFFLKSMKAKNPKKVYVYVLQITQFWMSIAWVCETCFRSLLHKRNQLQSP